MNTRLIFIITAILLACPTLAQQQNVSGRVQGPDGCIGKVSVREIDHNHRIFNHTQTDENGYFSFKVRDVNHSLQFYAPGYRTFTHRMLGQHSFKVSMEVVRTSPYVGKAKLVMKSKNLLCGKYQGEEVKQKVWVERLCDTLFTLILPVSVNSPIVEYPAGRTLLVLAENDRQLMQWENVVDVYPMSQDPDAVTERCLTQGYMGTDKLPGGSEDETAYYCYPHFQFSLAQLEYLCNHPEELQRIVVDTYQANNYWNFFPTSHTQSELQKLRRLVKDNPTNQK